MKPILSLLIITLLSTSLLCNEPKQKTQMTDEEFLKQFMALEERQEKAKAKTKALEKLEKTVDELAKIIGVDK